MTSIRSRLPMVRQLGLFASLLIVPAAINVVAYPVRAAVYDLSAGHADIGLGSSPGPRLFFQFGADAVASGVSNAQLLAGQPGGVPGEWSLESFVVVVPQSVQIPRPSGAEWDFLGTDAGDPVWIFSQQSQAGVPYLGFDTDKAGGGTGTFTLGNVTVRPPNGEVSLFQIGGFSTPDIVFWSTAQPAVDAVTVPAQTHVHYAFGFTEPGYYELPLIGTGSGFGGQATGTLAVQVVPEPSSMVLAAAALAAAGLLIRRRLAEKKPFCRAFPAV